MDESFGDTCLPKQISILKKLERNFVTPNFTQVLGEVEKIAVHNCSSIIFLL